MSADRPPVWLSRPYWEALPAFYGWAVCDGAPLYVERYRTPSRTGPDRAPFLLIEGLGYGSWMWFALLPELLSRRSVILFDNRGVGGSAGAGASLSIEQMADDAACVLGALDVGRAHVVGVSMGGFVAQALAVRHPGKVASLALVVTSAGGPDQEPAPESTVRAMTQREGLAPEEALRQAMRVAVSPGWWEAHQDVIERVVRWRLDRPVTSSVWAAQWQAIARFDYRDAVRDITAPTLVVAAGEDRVMPPSNTRALATRVPGARLIEFSGCGHWVFVERAAELALEIASHAERAEQELARS